ncbi:preprotein translocase subunit SecA [Candidatus Berkelbacteria bacterium CG10_big_fil_rev_8_21_14_0_10_33_10]|uniref:Protein translocase subunit SecA n=1 Tax=Candidatus Berkelbacteria bacterium CG_4_10_14_0_2_um_filter_35_9_33_12 TaxID=1974499 RepID=A0A2M7W4B8_9BACT|nr:MAG: preprotein translocase subunit SecA [Candidatus Berkelbacteria bacterium CG23_combo_of_CG06-09_8_20_14_all_33_15]PIS08656.1 MAG: preprotein translocase subunit SecA [Candidatus Berkelbacteria bacterium CG10_big_fil_rev_8_21_14_0_10_33_10]PJA20571.1 MAG: preprotein translocase subunit SecA [Candidatus Berkelbacteria bacterium CG_4_10_14_0_2_um_filter_35_9_33_12]
MFNNLFSKFFGSNESEIKKFQPIVDEINSYEEELKKLSLTELKEKTIKFREQLSKGKSLDDILPEAFATVREASRRSIGQRHYDVQLIAGIVLHRGNIAEMKTGEGKTLAATLPLYLNSLYRSSHLITVNDFLAKFQAQWMGKIFDTLGISISALAHETSFLYTSKKQDINDKTWEYLISCDRKTAYQADIVYGTNNEFGFDYLRDNMVVDSQHAVQNELYFAIVDEVDSILIDEARTPLIISAPANRSASLYMDFASLAKRLDLADYIIDEKTRSVAIQDSGIEKIEKWLNIDNLYAPENTQLVYHLEESLKAQYIFKKDKDYVIRNGEIVIVDEFTGRLMHGRRYSEGLHQAIEAKENVEVKKESETLATISFQNLFRLYKKLSGMTGTAVTEAEEFYKIYKIDVVEIPTHKPMIRNDHNDKIFKNEKAKLDAIVEEIYQRNEKGQPVLIGTISIAKNEILASLFKKRGIKHNLLNAKNHENEAKTIAQAGRLNAVTLATNIAGRGIDIILGGSTPKKIKEKNKKIKDINNEKIGLINLSSENRSYDEWEKEHRRVVELGGLFVLGTERHESRRIDNQLRGRSGRQGDPGESVFFVSMEDDLMRIFGGDRMKSMMERLGLPDNQPIENKLISRSIEQAQKKVESHNFDIRKHMLEYDDVLNQHRQAIYKKRKLILDGYGMVDSKKVKVVEELKSLLKNEEMKIIDEKLKEYGQEIYNEVVRRIYLSVIDRHWIEHLNSMTELRNGIGLRGYGQKDPLIEYKQSAYHFYQNLIRSIENQVVEMALKVEINPIQLQNIKGPMVDEEQNIIKSGGEAEASGDTIEEIEEETKQSETTESSTDAIITVRKKSDNHSFNTSLTAVPKVGRNESCPCGSGKKYKKCHGK